MSQADNLTTDDFVAAYPLISSDIFAEAVASTRDSRINEERSLGESLNTLAQLNLGQLQSLQDQIDDVIWTAPGEAGAKRRHILFHVVLLTGKLARVEERTDHRKPHNSDELNEAIADMLIFALQSANLCESSLLDLYRGRVFDTLLNLSSGSRVQGSLGESLNTLAQLNLGQLQSLQDQIDDVMWTAPGEAGAKRRHILFHLMILAAKLARVEERTDHRKPHNSDELNAAIADLLVFALQCANLSDLSLCALYQDRVRQRMHHCSESLD